MNPHPSHGPLNEKKNHIYLSKMSVKIVKPFITELDGIFEK
jgi:hypothetical protein